MQLNKDWNEKPTKASTDSGVSKLGTASTNHAVGLATNPTNENVLFYADETAVYTFDQSTGEFRECSNV